MKRDELVQGLRELANFYEATDFPLPSSLNVCVTSVHTKGEFSDCLRMLGHADKDLSGSYATLRKTFDPIELIVVGPRKEEVCTKWVVGVKQVTREVPDTYRTITEEIEDVVWDCPDSLLAND